MWSKDKLFLNLGKEDPLSSLNADSALSHSDVHLETVSVEVHLLHSFCESDRNWNLRLFLVFNTTIAGNSPARRILPSPFLFRGENYSHIKEPQIRNKSNKLTQKHFDWKLSLVLLLSVSSNQDVQHQCLHQASVYWSSTPHLQMEAPSSISTIKKGKQRYFTRFSWEAKLSDFLIVIVQINWRFYTTLLSSKDQSEDSLWKVNPLRHCPSLTSELAESRTNFIQYFSTEKVPVGNAKALK